MRKRHFYYYYFTTIVQLLGLLCLCLCADHEIKECAILAMGVLFSHAGDELSAQLPTVLGRILLSCIVLIVLFVAKLSKERLFLHMKHLSLIFIFFIFQ